MDLSFVRDGAPKDSSMKTLIFAGFAVGFLACPSVRAQAYPVGTGVDATRLLPGDWMPASLQADSYVLTDWQVRKLTPPPPGYRWVRDDASGQFLMASTTTGRIADAADQARARLPGTPQDQPQAVAPSPGDRLSGDDLDARFVVVDWRSIGLSEPDRGFHWVNIRGRYLLTSIRTGVVRHVTP